MRQTPCGNIIVRQIEKKPERSDEGERRDTGSDQNNDKDNGGPPATLKAPLVMNWPREEERGPTWDANDVVAVSFNEARYAAFFSIARQPEPPARSSQSDARFRAIAFARPNAPDPYGCVPYAREDPEIS